MGEQMKIISVSAIPISAPIPALADAIASLDHGNDS
jgi:hypothetical protein